MSEGEDDRRYEDAIEAFVQLTNVVDAVSAVVYERGIVARSSRTELRSLLSRFVWSLAVAKRCARGAPERASSPYDFLREWLESPSFTARQALADLWVSSEELDLLDRLGQARMRSIATRFFGDEGFGWTTLSPRSLHYAICRLHAATFDFDRGKERVRVAKKNDPVSPIDTAAEHVVDATFGAALREQAQSGERTTWQVFDPRCGTGAFLLAAVRVLRRELASRPRGALLVDGAVRAFVRDELRGTDDDAMSVALARLGLWLETDESLSSSDLRRAVVVDARSAFWPQNQGAKTFWFSDATAFTPSDALTAILRTSRVGDRVGALVDVGLASGPAGEPARAEWDGDFVTERPLIEPRLRSPIERPRTLALLAVRRARVRGEAGDRWAHHIDGVSELERRLLLSLSVEPSVSSIAESTRDGAGPRDAARAWPKVYVSPSESPLDAWLVPSASRTDAMLFTANAPGWTGFALLALLHSTIVWWQRSMLAASRRANGHTMRDVLELAVPSYCDPSALREAGAQLVAARSEQEVRVAVAAIDMAAGFGRGLDEPCKQMLAAWRRGMPLPEPSFDDSAGGAPDASLDPVSSEPSRPSQPPLAPRPPTSTHPSPRGAHEDSAAQYRHTKSNGALAHGSESMLRNRSDDGRAAARPGPKRAVSQPEGDAQREAWAILCAAGADGLALSAVVRRAREHDEDEIREAISSLIADAWVEVASDDDGLALAEPRLNDEARLRPLAR